MRHWVVWIGGVLFVALGAGACQEANQPSVGSESHFLTTCNQTCGSDLECLCGVCTARCAEAATCTPLNDRAECVAVAERPSAAACPDEPAPAFCDVRCAADLDCASLGSAFACTSGFCRDRDGGLFSDGRVELAELCAFYVADVCRAELGCYGWNYRDQAHCEAAQDCAGWELLNRELAAGRVSVDPVATYDCHQRLAADPCALGLMFEAPTLPEALSACDALTGLTPVGGACEVSAECVEGAQCDLASTCPGLCVESEAAVELGSVPLGGACTAMICLDLDDDPTNDAVRCEQCALGLTCYQDTCRPEWALGEACSDTQACSPTAWCDTTAGACAPLAEAGEACNGIGYQAPPCVPGLFCLADAFDVGTCRPPSEAGGPCVDEYDCLEGLRCIPVAVGDPLGTCGTPAANGSGCRWNEDCQSGFCAADGACATGAVGVACLDSCLNCTSSCGAGLSCIDGACAAERYPGDACAAGDVCQASRCEGGVCTILQHLGEACATAEDCLSGRCEAGACADAADCPAAE